MRRLLLSFVVLFALVLTACGDDDSTGPGSANISGTYTLRTINGSNLPFTVFQVGADKVEVLSGNVTLTNGGAYTTLSTVRTTLNGVVTTEPEADAGTYTRNGTAMTLRSNDDGTTVSGTVSNGVLTVVFEGFSAVYRR